MSRTPLGAGERAELLEGLASIPRAASWEEGSDLLGTFLPLREHARVLDRRTLVVQGGRGAGKTVLFSVLSSLGESLESAPGLLGADATPQGRWIVGYSGRGDGHPSEPTLRGFGGQTDADGARLLWLLHLAGRVAEEVVGFDHAPEALSVWRRQRHDVGAWVEAGRQDIAGITAWLDACDGRLAAAGDNLVLTYDDLDRIAVREPEVRTLLSGQLLALWQSLLERYRALRARVFIGEDLFEASAARAQDAGRLRALSVSLRWDVASAYRLLARHLAHASDALRRWLEEAGIELTSEEGLGWMPPGPFDDDLQRRLVGRLVGEVMGRGITKGYVHRWIPARLTDGRRALAPRSMLDLFGSSAAVALRDGPQAGGPRLLHPAELQAGLGEASRRRVRELAEEHPVLGRFERLSELKVMAAEKDVRARLAELPPGERDDGFGEDGERVLEELIRLGTMVRRPDGRIDVPDIYRYGYGIKRKGGVRRPR